MITGIIKIMNFFNRTGILDDESIQDEILEGLQDSDKNINNRRSKMNNNNSFDDGTSSSINEEKICNGLNKKVSKSDVSKFVSSFFKKMPNKLILQRP